MRAFTNALVLLQYVPVSIVTGHADVRLAFAEGVGVVGESEGKGGGGVG